MKDIIIYKDLIEAQKKEIEALKEELNLLRKKEIKTGKLKGKTSKFKGVSFDSKNNVFRAQIYIAGKVRPLGTFPATLKGEFAAAEKYKEAKENKVKLAVKYQLKDLRDGSEASEREQRILDEKFLDKKASGGIPNAEDILN